MPEPLRYDMTLPNGDPLRYDMGPEYVWGGNVPAHLYPQPPMPNDNRISATLTQADKDAIIAAVQTIRSKLPFLISLTQEERQELFKLGDKSAAFDQKCADYMASHPQFAPTYAINLTEVGKDRSLRTDVLDIWAHLGPLADDAQSTLMLIGHELMIANNIYYRTVREASKTGVPGAQAIYQELRERYPNNPTTPPAPPNP